MTESINDENESKRRKSKEMMRSRCAATSSTEKEMYEPDEESHDTRDDEEFEVVQHSSKLSNSSKSGTNLDNTEGAQKIGGSGPEDKTLLVSFDCHIARSTWDMKQV